MTGEEETSHELSIGLQPWVDEVVRIKNALATGDGDKEDIITYAKEIRALRSKLDRATEALEKADAALCGFACHLGEAVPCIRTKEQCTADCGKEAGDALICIRTTLSFIKGEEHAEA